jgi:hypothetical protein
MAIITIHKNDSTITVDGFATFEQDVSALANNIWVVQFNSSSNTGHIEYTDGTANEDITSITSDMQALVDANASAKSTADEAASDAADAQTALEATYGFKRQAEYPSIGDQLDSLFHAGTFDSTMTATIQAVKDKYPK